MKQLTTYQHAYELLERSFDQDLTLEETFLLERAFQQWPQLLEEQRQIALMRSLLSEYSVPEAPHFAEAVLQKIQQQQQRPVKRLPIIRLAPYIAAAGLAFLGILLGGLYFSEGTLNTEILLGVQDIRPEDAIVLLAN